MIKAQKGSSTFAHYIGVSYDCHGPGMQRPTPAPLQYCSICGGDMTGPVGTNNLID